MQRSLKVIPAIDLINGQCVRLEKGDFESVKYYEVSAIEVAKSYEHAGAEFLHIVDLDGAKNKAMSQSNLIGETCKSTQMSVQVGGGVRSSADVEKLLGLGVNRVVIGSMAVKDREKTLDILNTFGSEKIVLALDVNIDAEGVPMIATEGWQSGSKCSLWDTIEVYKGAGLKHILCTDIARDGMLEGPSIALYQMCMEKYPNIQWQASGGVSCLADLKKLSSLNISGVIIGKALYEKRFTLSDALNVVDSESEKAC